MDESSGGSKKITMKCVCRPRFFFSLLLGSCSLSLFGPPGHCFPPLLRRVACLRNRFLPPAVPLFSGASALSSARQRRSHRRGQEASSRDRTGDFGPRGTESRTGGGGGSGSSSSALEEARARVSSA